MLFDRIAPLISGKIQPKNIEEKILVKAYNSALGGKTLLRSYFDLKDLFPISEDKIDAFILGFSIGAQVYNVSVLEREFISDSNLN